MRVHSEDRTRSVAWVIALVVLAAGHRGPTASAVGGVCALAASAADGLAVEASVVVVSAASAAVGFDVKTAAN